MLSIFESCWPRKTVLKIHQEISGGQKQIFSRDDCKPAGCWYQHIKTKIYLDQSYFLVSSVCKRAVLIIKKLFQENVVLPPFSVYTTAMWRCSSDATLFIFAKMNFIKFYSWNFQGNVSTLLICEIGSVLSRESSPAENNFINKNIFIRVKLIFNPRCWFSRSY